MAHVPGKDNTSISEIANVMLDPKGNQPYANHLNSLNDNAHFSGVDNGYQSPEDIRNSRGREHLSFQEWTAKYHQ